MNPADKEWLLVTLLACAILSVPFGWITVYVLDDTPADDSDCTTQSPVDERGPGCREICTTGPAWYIWGTRQNCYWDDAPPGEEAQ